LSQKRCSARLLLQVKTHQADDIFVKLMGISCGGEFIQGGALSVAILDV
jgi:hypothetical protein